ncbi:TPA: hypothetical protein QC285_004066 [Bacillus cereus]|nr:hypothetical protein [Bacillus cereus]
MATTLILSEVHSRTYVEPSKMLYGECLESWFNTKRHSVGIQTAKVLKESHYFFTREYQIYKV